jgi:hypothetical protein
MGEGDGGLDLGGETGEKAFLRRLEELRSQGAARTDIPCHIYFYQENSAGIIEIGGVPIGEKEGMASRLAAGRRPPAVARVILDSNMARLDSIHRLFARFGLQDRSNPMHFQPDPKLLNTIKAIAQEWPTEGH